MPAGCRVRGGVGTSPARHERYKPSYEGEKRYRTVHLSSFKKRTKSPLFSRPGEVRVYTHFEMFTKPALPMTHAVLLAIALTLSSSKQRADSVRTETEVRETVIRHASDVRRCYTDEGLRRNPTLSGAVELEITILPTGTVNSAAVATTSLSGLGQREVTGCLTTAARNWRFERGPYAVETVVFPFVFFPDQKIALERVNADDEEE